MEVGIQVVLIVAEISLLNFSCRRAAKKSGVLGCFVCILSVAGN